MASECTALIDSAERSPFGWGWSAEVPDQPLKEQGITPLVGARAGRARSAPLKPRRAVPIDAAETAVLGIELYWAGQLLGEEKYKEAAFEAARGAASVQARTGQIRSTGQMGTTAGSQDTPADVPERFTTRAALGLMLTLIDADRPPINDSNSSNSRGATPPRIAPESQPDRGDVAPRLSGGTKESRDPAASDRHWADRLKGPATHAAFWLAGQQTNLGGWPSPYPPDAPIGRAYRIIHLDDPGYRDSVCALLLAGEVLDDNNLRRYADRACDELIQLRLTDFRTGGRPLWGTANTLDGDMPRKFPELINGYDLLASRYAMQALLASYLINLQKRDNDALSQAAQLISSLPREDGKWGRYYGRRDHTSGAAATSQPANLFGPAAPIADGGDALFGLPPVLDAVTQIDAVGGKKYGDFLAAKRPLKTRLVDQMCGLSDDALAPRSDANAAENNPPRPAPAWPRTTRPGRLWELLQEAP